MAQIRDYSENAHTSNYSLSEGESGTLHTDRGATGIVTIYLPEDAAMGIYFTFSSGPTYAMRIDPGADTILLNTNSPADKYINITSPVKIGNITLVSNGFNEWYPLHRRGVWSHEA